MVSPFRFAVVAVPSSGEAWLSTTRRAASLGYATVLMPDGLQLPAPFPSLAMAAAAAPISVGTWVLAAPLRPPLLAAWEAHTLTRLTGGRFELGIGTGRPVVEQWTREMGLPWGSGSERLAQVAEVIDRLRELDGPDTRTPVLMAAAGPLARRLALEKADVLALAVGALTSRDEVASLLRDARQRADLRIATSIFVVGDQLPPHAQRYIGADLAQLRSAQSLALLEGSPRQMADELLHRRGQFDMSYVTVNAEYLEQFAPVVELLAGQ